MHTTTARTDHIPLVEIVVMEDLDSDSVPRLGELVDEALAVRPDELVIDLAGCARLDAAAIGLLIDAHRRTSRSGGRMTLRSPSARLRRNLRLAHADGVLDITTGGTHSDDTF